MWEQDTCREQDTHMNRTHSGAGHTHEQNTRRSRTHSGEGHTREQDTHREQDLGWASVLGGCFVAHTALWDPRKTLEAFPN